MENGVGMTWGSELRVMPSNTPLPWKLISWAVTMVLLIGGNIVSAQEESAAKAAPAEVEATNESSQSDATDPAQPQTDPAGAVLDYEPSESISEDLSVSFPVDI